MKKLLPILAPLVVGVIAGYLLAPQLVQWQPWRKAAELALS